MKVSASWVRIRPQKKCRSLDSAPGSAGSCARDDKGGVAFHRLGSTQGRWATQDIATPTIVAPTFYFRRSGYDPPLPLQQSRTHQAVITGELRSRIDLVGRIFSSDTQRPSGVYE